MPIRQTRLHQTFSALGGRRGGKSHPDAVHANEVWQLTEPSALLKDDKVQSHYLGLKKIEEKPFVIAYCYRKDPKKRKWIERLKIIVSLRLDGRIYARISEQLTKKYNNRFRHLFWHYICRLEELSYESIVNVIEDWETVGYMVRRPDDAYLRAETVVRALEKMQS